MLLDYARPSTRFRRFGLSAVAGTASLLFGGAAAWCVLHAVRFEAALQQASFCGNCEASRVANLGLPPGHTIPLGVFSGGCALVAAVQSVRLANSARV
jgi:hypothetical protein